MIIIAIASASTIVAQRGAEQARVNRDPTGALHAERDQQNMVLILRRETW